MFDLPQAHNAAANPPAANAAYQGPERRHTHALHWRWLALMLDEVDHGMLLLLDGHHVVHANHVARAELDSAHPLQLLGRELRARDSADVAPLHEAISAAVLRGLRRLIALGRGAQRISIAVVPLAAGQEHAATLLVFGKRRVCGELSAQGYARCHGLTQAEAVVLQRLCDGQEPQEIAAGLGVAISTVRTQISAIRAKTDTASIRELVQRVAMLPPLVSALRSGHIAVVQGDTAAPLPAVA
jgi:DNA-binding CsgD family transcriptional regulator